MNGIWAARYSSRGISEFFIGVRSMGLFVMAFSAVASGRSVLLLPEFTGMAYSMGFSAVWAVADYTIMEFYFFFFMHPGSGSSAVNMIVRTHIHFGIFRSLTNQLFYPDTFHRKEIAGNREGSIVKDNMLIYLSTRRICPKI